MTATIKTGCSPESESRYTEDNNADLSLLAIAELSDSILATGDTLSTGLNVETWMDLKMAHGWLLEDPPADACLLQGPTGRQAGTIGTCKYTHIYTYVYTHAYLKASFQKSMCI